MSKHPGFSAELLKLCGQMRDQSITPPEAARLSDMLAEHKQARQFYLQFMSITAALETGQAESTSQTEATSSDSEVGLLLDLLRMEQDAVAEPVPLGRSSNTIQWSAKRPQKHASTGRLDKSLVLYIAGQAVRSTPAKWLVAAAMIALGVLLAIQFIGPSAASDPAPVVDNTATKPTESAPPIPRDHPVATLTATHNAQWSDQSAERALARGSQLHSGTRLTLTAGFAEITTRNGAIAILEAPVTVELLDNNNALRLHTGKLVGICETGSSKGFLVRTPHIDVTDLGTRFGVDATNGDATEVHVLEGEVQAVHTGANAVTAPTRLLAGQAIRAEGATERLVAIDQDTARFHVIAKTGDSALPLGASKAGIAALSGDAAWSLGSAYIDTGIDHWTRDDRVIVVEELPAYRLAADTPVTLAGPGSRANLDQLPTGQAIPAGTTVRTYVMVLYPQSGGSTRPKGSVTFEGEVLGIATTNEEFDVLSRMIGDAAPRTMITTPGPFETHQTDVVAIEDDRRTVSFAWKASKVPGEGDAVRVFVRVSAGQKADPN